MANCGLDQILLDVLLHIMELTDAAHKRSLQSLALVSRRLRTVSSTILFRKLTVYKSSSRRSIENFQTLSRDVLDNVRHLVIEDEEVASTSAETKLLEISFSNTPNYYLRKIYGPAHRKDQPDSNQLWLLLSQLIKHRLPKLHEITFNCPEQFPSCIL